MESLLAAIGLLMALLVTGIGVGVGIAIGMELSMRMSGDERTVILTLARTRSTSE